MQKAGASGLIVIALVMLATGFVLCLDLVDWLINAIEFLFIAGGLLAGVIGVLKLLTSRGGRRATSV